MKIVQSDIFIPVTAPSDVFAVLDYAVEVFVSERSALLDQFTYLVLRDQNGVNHYWWVVGDTLVDDPTQPTHATLTPINLTVGGPFEWLQVDAVDQPATQMYLWPHINGFVLVDTSPPPTGTGFDVNAGIALRDTAGQAHRLAAHSAGFETLDLVP